MVVDAVESGREPCGRRAAPRYPWWWLVPSLVVLVGLAAWGAVVCPKLPDQVPAHVGPGGVDRWTAKSFWSVFLPVIVYAGTTGLFAACALLALRRVPETELPPPRDRWEAAARSVDNRSYSRDTALRTARAMLATNAVLGVVFVLVGCVQWRTERVTAVPGWLTAALYAAVLLSAVPLLVAWHRERLARRRGASG